MTKKRRRARPETPPTIYLSLRRMDSVRNKIGSIYVNIISIAHQYGLPVAIWRFRPVAMAGCLQVFFKKMERIWFLPFKYWYIINVFFI
jgi:hypothetical protein